MKAIVIREFGPPEVLLATELPDPVAGPGQVLIDVAYANITFVETLIRAGRAPGTQMSPQLPMIPGNGVGGTVSAVGEGVGGEMLGRRVIASLGGNGGYAERVAADADALVEVPDVLALADAVALLADGRTALALTRQAEIAAGQTVLVEAAAGGVGSLLVQLARSVGARVVGATGGSDKVDVVRSLGVELAVDYDDPVWTERIRTEVGEVDVALDGVGGELSRQAFGLVRAAGTFSSFGVASGDFSPVTDLEAAKRGVRLIRGGPRLSSEQLRELVREALAEATAGRLRPLIGQTFALERAADAHAAIEARQTVGKTLLTV
jgi:NADPH:quinone reductase